LAGCVPVEAFGREILSKRKVMQGNEIRSIRNKFLFQKIFKNVAKALASTLPGDVLSYLGHR
jgi:hypothetical protein